MLQNTERQPASGDAPLLRVGCLYALFIATFVVVSVPLHRQLLALVLPPEPPEFKSISAALSLVLLWALSFAAR